MPGRQNSRLYAINSIINLGLGLVLLVFPSRAIALLGLPQTDTNFYVMLLGAILLGIGLALWIDWRNHARWRGLGLAGAVAINVLGAGTLAAWLIVGPFDLPLRCYVVLRAVVVVVLGTAIAELMALTRPKP